MIDIEKLRIAHELFEKLKPGAIMSIRMCTGMTSDLSCDLLWYFDENAPEGFKNSKYYNSLDELIAKLQQLVCSNPKYKIGERIWIACGRGFYSRIINKISPVYYGGYTYSGDDFCLGDDEFYPTLESLVKAQIQYWESVK